MFSRKDLEKLASIAIYLSCAVIVMIPLKEPRFGLSIVIAYILCFLGPFFYRELAPEFVQVFSRRISNYVNNFSAKTNYTLCVVLFVLLLWWSWWFNS